MRPCWSTFSDAEKIRPYNPLTRVPTLVLYRKNLTAGPELLPARSPGVGAAVPADTAGFQAGLARDAVRAMLREEVAADAAPEDDEPLGKAAGLEDELSTAPVLASTPSFAIVSASARPVAFSPSFCWNSLSAA